jgi:HAD superfamily hydrolase (TIGR01662 family)
MARRIQGILFDLGDTLVQYADLPVNRLFVRGAVRGYEYLKSLGKPLPARFIYMLRQLTAIRWAHLRGWVTGVEFDAIKLLSLQSRRMGHPLSRQETIELAWQFYSPLKEQAPFYPEVRGVLEDLRDQGYQLGIVSNSFLPGQVLDRHLADGDLLDLLPVRVYSCEVNVRKPKGGIFQAALEQTGLTAEETMFVGDTPKEDIDGACEMGMVTVLRKSPPPRKCRKHQPDHVIEDLRELEGILAEYDSPTDSSPPRSSSAKQA